MATAETLQQLLNQALTTGEFPSNLKNADVTPVFQKNNLLSKENYRPVSVLPIISKVFEKLMQNQINIPIKPFLLPFLCAYRKGFNSQYALISLIERLIFSCVLHTFCIFLLVLPQFLFRFCTGISQCFFRVVSCCILLWFFCTVSIVPILY